MPISSKLLERAYQLSESGDVEDVFKILDTVLQTDPGNVEAWEFYLQICNCIDDLDWLADRVLGTEGLSEDEKGDILDYYNYRVDKLVENSPRQVHTQEPVTEEPMIIPNDIHLLESSQSTHTNPRGGQFSLTSSKNVVPMTIILLIATYILDKTIPNNGLIGFFIVLALSFLYVYWLTTAGIFHLPISKSRNFAEDVHGLDEFEEDGYLEFDADE
jgi:hypothetical protein